MRFKISKSQWEKIGKTAGWINIGNTITKKAMPDYRKDLESKIELEEYKRIFKSKDYNFWYKFEIGIFYPLNELIILSDLPDHLVAFLNEEKGEDWINDTISFEVKGELMAEREYMRDETGEGYAYWVDKVVIRNIEFNESPPDEISTNEIIKKNMFNKVKEDIEYYLGVDGNLEPMPSKLEDLFAKDVKDYDRS